MGKELYGVKAFPWQYQRKKVWILCVHSIANSVFFSFFHNIRKRKFCVVLVTFLKISNHFRMTLYFCTHRHWQVGFKAKLFQVEGCLRVVLLLRDMKRLKGLVFLLCNFSMAILSLTNHLFWMVLGNSSKERLHLIALYWLWKDERKSKEFLPLLCPYFP